MRMRLPDGGDRDTPAFAQGEVAQEPLDGVNAYGSVERGAVAARLARVIANAAVDGRQRVIGYQPFPGGFEVAGLGESEPALNIFAGRARHVARRQLIEIHRALHPHRAGPFFAGKIDDPGYV